MSIALIFGIGFILTLVQVSLFKLFPRWWRNLCAAVPLFGFFANLGISSFIVAFTGVASIVGISNLLASVIFGFYLMAYKGVHRIQRRGWKRFLFILARPDIVEGRKQNVLIF